MYSKISINRKPVKLIVVQVSLLGEVASFHCVRRKHSRDHRGRPGLMVRFSEVGVNAKGCPGFSTVPLRRESRLVFSKARTKDCVKYPVPYLNLVWSTFSHHLASLACVPRCLTAESHLEPTLESAQVPWGC